MNPDADTDYPDDDWKSPAESGQDAYKSWRKEAGRRLDRLSLPRSFVDWLFLFPDVGHLAVRFFGDPEVPKDLKVRFLAALGYATANNLVPRRVPLRPLRLIEDLAALGIGLETLFNGAPPWVAQRHWAGNKETLRSIQSLLASAGNWLPTIRATAQSLKGIFPRKR